MRSSYKKNNYEKIFRLLSFVLKPKRCVEFGILDGYSLKSLVESCSKECSIEAYDIFEEFPGNAANYEKITNIFKEHKNVTIKRGDFYVSQNDFEDGSIDILHIDIANNGATYAYVIEHYMTKLSNNGVCVLEGGSQERDEVYWMRKYDKPKIRPVLKEIKKTHLVYTIDDHPSITFVMNKKRNK